MKLESIIPYITAQIKMAPIIIDDIG